MNAQWIFLVFFICSISLSYKADAFCTPSKNGHALYANLTRAVVRSTDWMRKFYKEKATEPYRAGSIFATLRIAGHRPKTLLTDYKNASGFSIEETLNDTLYSHNSTNGNLSAIPTPHLGLIIQGVISICKDPRNFTGHNLTKLLREGFPQFKTYPSFNNYFGYSLAVIALYNSGEKIPESVIRELINGTYRKVSYYSVDIDALILTALSCVSRSNVTLQHEVDNAMSYLVEGLITKQNKTTGAFGNQYSTALAVEALEAARVHHDVFLCEKAMKHILSYQDEEGSFSTILANIQVTPSLLGESLISLKNYACPDKKRQQASSKNGHDLYANLTRAVVRSTDWMRKFYKENATEPHRAGSIFATLRIAGHRSKTLLNDFKNALGYSIEETLNHTLDSKNGDLSNISVPHLGLIIQGVISICKDPRNFHGHDLIQTFLNRFKTYRSFNNYFNYSLAVIALCNADEPISDNSIQELINGTCRKVGCHSVDTNALILTALSCVSSSNITLQREVYDAISYLVKGLISKQNKKTGAFGNQYSTALAVEALQAARVHQDVFLFEKAMKHILSYQDEEGSFGSILANIQVTPSLLGESLISLKDYACPVEPKPTPIPQNISVQVQIVFNVTNMTRTVPAVPVGNITEGTTAKVILDKAMSVIVQNPDIDCEEPAVEYKKYSFGHSITSICGVAKDWRKRHYWMIYVNGKTAQYGVDGLKPKDGDIITFIYKKLNF